MKAPERDYIKSCTQELIDLINCNTCLRARLSSILSEEETNELYMLYKHSTKQETNNKLLEMVKTKKNGYEILKNALQQTFQSGAVELLEKIDTEKNAETATGNIREVTEIKNGKCLWLISLLVGICFSLVVVALIVIIVVFPCFLPHIQYKNESEENLSKVVATFNFSQNRSHHGSFSNEIQLGGKANQLFFNGFADIIDIQRLYNRVNQLDLIYFNNTNQQICRNKLTGPSIRALSMILSKNVRKLSLENFGQKCNKLFMLLTSHARVWNLESLTFIGGEIYFRNVGYFEMILHQTEESLTELNLNYTRKDIPLFTNIPNYAYTQLHSIVLNVSSTPSALYILPKRLCQTFPKLKQFYSLQLPLPLFVIESLPECTNLINLDARVSIPIPILNAEVLVSEIKKMSERIFALSYQIPSLKEVYLDLQFLSCPATLNVTPFISEEVVVDRTTSGLINLELTTNCGS